MSFEGFTTTRKRIDGPVMLSACLVMIVAAAVCGCATWKDPVDFESAPLLGMIYDGARRPCSGVSVSIDRKGAIYRRAVTDMNGRFMITAVRRGKHVLFISKDGYESREIPFDFLNRTQVFHLRMLSGAEVAEECADALIQRRWITMQELTARLAGISGYAGMAAFFDAVQAYMQGEYAEATACLEEIESMDVPNAEEFDRDVFLAFLRHLRRLENPLEPEEEGGEDADG